MKKIRFDKQDTDKEINSISRRAKKKGQNIGYMIRMCEGDSCTNFYELLLTEKH